VIADRLMHALARAAVRLRPPLDAKRVVDTFGRLLPPLSPERAMALAESLEGRGTCLTRALVVAARLPGSVVVLGTDGVQGQAFSAHAWVEHGGMLIGGLRTAKCELVRLGTS
jgi:hypothetical protein